MTAIFPEGETSEVLCWASEVKLEKCESLKLILSRKEGAHMLFPLLNLLLILIHLINGWRQHSKQRSGNHLSVHSY